MAWSVPEFDPQQVNAAGRALGRTAFPVETIEGAEALHVINNWRSAHAYPLNTFQITLRNKARKIEKGVIVAQRAKRLDSIHRKLAAKESTEANRVYTDLESQIPDESRRQVVLVSVADINALKRAYPNYFLDTALFSRLVDRVLKGDFPDPLPPQLPL